MKKFEIIIISLRYYAIVKIQNIIFLNQAIKNMRDRIIMKNLIEK